MNTEPYPLLLKPAYKDYLWGGERIVQHFNRDEPPGIYAESWEVSDRPEGSSVILNGPASGRPLGEVISREPGQWLGSHVTGASFPLLIKLIDAKQKLSVQVHPNDAAAAQYGGEAKTEMWYVLDAEPEAYVYAGLQDGVDEQAFRRAVETDTVEDILVRIPVASGDAVFMRGGRVHAIGEGCLLLEVQQNSNTTYRIYDWGRVGPDGLPRELHIDQALRVILWDDTESARVEQKVVEENGENRLTEVLSTDYFKLERIDLSTQRTDTCDGTTFHALFIAEGTARLEAGEHQATLRAGLSCLLPATAGDYSLASAGAVILRVSIP